MSDGREEREEQEKRREQQKQEPRPDRWNDWIDHHPVDEWEPERGGSRIPNQLKSPFAVTRHKSPINCATPNY